MFNSLLSIFFSFCLIVIAGCKADSIEIKLSDADIQDAIDGEEVDVDFEAQFSLLGELDEEGRVDLDRLVSIVRGYVELEDVELESELMGVKVLVEGSIPISASELENSPWFIKVSQWDDEQLRVELATGSSFPELADLMGDVNFLLSADPYHPIKYKLKAKGSLVTAPAVEINGRTYLLYRETVDKRITMNFSGGPYDNVGGGFLIRLP